MGGEETPAVRKYSLNRSNCTRILSLSAHQKRFNVPDVYKKNLSCAHRDCVAGSVPNFSRPHMSECSGQQLKGGIKLHSHSHLIAEILQRAGACRGLLISHQSPSFCVSEGGEEINRNSTPAGTCLAHNWSWMSLACKQFDVKSCSTTFKCMHLADLVYFQLQPLKQYSLSPLILSFTVTPFHNFSLVILIHYIPSVIQFLSNPVYFFWLHQYFWLFRSTEWKWRFPSSTLNI